MFQYEAKVIRWVDGDTAWLDIDLGFRIHTEIQIRLAHINTPEIVTYQGAGIVDPALQHCEHYLPPGSVCVVDVSRPEKYGRYLAVVYYQLGVTDREKIMQGPRVLNDELIKAGFATRYEGVTITVLR